MATLTGTRSIVLIDDEPFILASMRSLLTRAGYDVHVCEEWSNVASTVRSVSPDLILLDYNMPSLKGDAICRALKGHGVAADILVYIFSSEPESDLVRIASECGADGYIRKNVPAPEILARVGSLLPL